MAEWQLCIRVILGAEKESEFAHVGTREEAAMKAVAAADIVEDCALSLQGVIA